MSRMTMLHDEGMGYRTVMVHLQDAECDGVVLHDVMGCGVAWLSVMWCGAALRCAALRGIWHLQNVGQSERSK